MLHTIGFEDGGTVRPIIHRASFSELVIPYGDATPGGYRKNAFDLGEYGAGPLTNALELGVRLRRPHPLLRRAAVRLDG